MYGDTRSSAAWPAPCARRATGSARRPTSCSSGPRRTPWPGLAAEAMRARAWQGRPGCDTPPSCTTTAADALIAHADEVDRLKALIAAIEHKVHAPGRRGPDRLAAWSAR